MARIRVTPSVRSYHTIKMVDEAINLFGEMHHNNMIPDIVTYSTHGL